MLTDFAERPSRVTVTPLPERKLLVALCDDIHKVEGEQSAETVSELWQADRYTLVVPALPGLAGRIEQNFDAWLERAKRENVRPPDPLEQLRADVDYLAVMGGAEL